MFDLKVMNSVLSELEEERGIPKAKVLEAIEAAPAVDVGNGFNVEYQDRRTHRRSLTRDRRRLRCSDPRDHTRWRRWWHPAAPDTGQFHGRKRGAESRPARTGLYRK